MRRASRMSFGMIVTLLSWMAHRLTPHQVCFGTFVQSWHRSDQEKRMSVFPMVWMIIQRTKHRKETVEINMPVDFWQQRISRRQQCLSINDEAFFLLLFLAYPYTREFIMFARRVSLSGHYDFNFNKLWENVLLAVYVCG